MGEYGIAGCWYRAYTGRPLECLAFKASAYYYSSPIKLVLRYLGCHLLLHNLPWAELCRDLWESFIETNLIIYDTQTY